MNNFLEFAAMSFMILISCAFGVAVGRLLMLVFGNPIPALLLGIPIFENQTEEYGNKSV